MKDLIIALVLFVVTFYMGFLMGRLSVWSDRTNILRKKKP